MPMKSGGQERSSSRHSSRFFAYQVHVRITSRGTYWTRRGQPGSRFSSLPVDRTPRPGRLKGASTCVLFSSYDIVPHSSRRAPLPPVLRAENRSIAQLLFPRLWTPCRTSTRPLPSAMDLERSRSGASSSSSAFEHSCTSSHACRLPRPTTSTRCHPPPRRTTAAYLWWSPVP